MGPTGEHSTLGGQAPHPPKKAPRRTFFRRIFIENLGIKLTSMFLAVALLLVVRQDQSKEADIEIPVVLSNKSDSEEFVGALPKTLRIRVRDRWSRLAKALERKSSAYMVDLRGFSNGSIYTFDREQIQRLLGGSTLTIQSIYPSQFDVKLEQRLEKTVPVRANLVGEVPEGYMVSRDKVIVTPDKIKIWGAISSVQQVNDITTHSIDLAVMDKSARIEIQVQNPGLPFLTFEHERVQVEVSIAEMEGKHKMGTVDLHVRNCPENLECNLTPLQAKLTLQGPIPTLLRVERGELPVEVYIDAADFEGIPGKYPRARLLCDRPQGVECLISPRLGTLVLTSPHDETASNEDGPARKGR